MNVFFNRSIIVNKSKSKDRIRKVIILKILMKLYRWIMVINVC